MFDPNQDVFVIDEVDCKDPLDKAISVRPGKVIRVRAEVLVTETTLLYDVRLESSVGTKQYEETDLFATLPAAIAEYQTRDLTP